MNTKAQPPTALQTQKLLREATNELGDHFSRLGGSARYQGMDETDIPLYLCYLVSALAKLDLNNFEYQWVSDFERHGESSVLKIKNLLSVFSWNEMSATEAINNYIIYISKKPKNCSGRRWDNFLKKYNV